MKNKKNTWLKVLAFIIVMVVIVSGFYAGLDDGKDDKNKAKVKQIQKTEVEKVKQNRE